MNEAGNWGILDLTEDPVKGDPTEARALAYSSQQEAQYWTEQVQSLRNVADQGSSMDMQGDYAPRYRQALTAHPTAAQALQNARQKAGQALTQYSEQLEQAKREAQMALQQGVRAKETYTMAMARYEQASAELASLPRLVPPEQLAYYQQLFYQLQAEQQRAAQMMQQAERDRIAARQRAVQAGQRAQQSESTCAQALQAAAPNPPGATGRAQSPVGGPQGPVDPLKKIADDLLLSNPYMETADGFKINCTHCVQAYELRRRGFDVQATSLPQQFHAGGGRPVDFIEKAWGRNFTWGGGRADIEKAFSQPGARGVVYIKWNGPGAHVFTVENVNGKVRFLDPQSGEIGVGRYFGQGHSLGHVRLDDIPWVPPSGPFAKVPGLYE